MYSGQQDMIADTVRRIFSDHAAEAQRHCENTGGLPLDLWGFATENGLHLALASEAAGGSELTWQDAWPILHGMGYWQVPLPLAETMIAAALLSAAGIAIPAGPMTIIEAGRQPDLRLSRDGDSVRLDGAASEVPWAAVAGWAVVSGEAEGTSAIALVELADRGVALVAGRNTAGEPRDSVRFAGVRCHALARRPSHCPAQPVFLLGAIARCAMMVGALEAAMKMSVTYANDRLQFGRPIGKYQAIQQALAELAGEVVSARMATQVAFCSLSEDEGWRRAAFDIAVAKVRTGEAATRVPAIAHQVHGAIGFTHEHALHLATRRLWSWRREFGSDALWAARLGEAAIDAGSQGFWRGVTAHSLLVDRVA
jgi:acyl-CoA dehydrogenase